MRDSTKSYPQEMDWKRFTAEATNIAYRFVAKSTVAVESRFRQMCVTSPSRVIK